MNLIENYYIWNFNNIIISKLLLNNTKNLPKLKKLSFIFILKIKQYKKNNFLFFILISLIFGNILILKNEQNKDLQIFNFILKDTKLKFFFFNFVNIYLPIINTNENLIKYSLNNINDNKILLYRLNYFSFPCIFELDIFYLKNEQIYNYVSNYRLQLDIYIKTTYFLKNSLNFILRMYRLPYKLSKR
jgi:hypothetical protein